MFDREDLDLMMAALRCYSRVQGKSLDDQSRINVLLDKLDVARADLPEPEESAFPCQFLGINHGQLSHEDTENQQGMSLRDFFAGCALIGEVASYSTPGSCRAAAEAAHIRVLTAAENAAHNAYELADAMLRAREDS